MFNLQTPKPRIFGNYLLKDFNDVVVPNSISLAPSTPAAWGLIIVIAAVLVLAIWWLIHLWHLNAYRREALAALRQCPHGNAVAMIPSCLRQVAAKAYPNLQVGALTGSEWFEFLNASAKSTLFSSDIQQHLDAVEYQSPKVWEKKDELNTRLFEATLQWIEKHQPEKAISL